jgi:hypothetical protein
MSVRYQAYFNKNIVKVAVNNPLGGLRGILIY